MFGLFSLSTLALAGLYLYVGVAAYKMEAASGASLVVAFTKAASWPATIWSSIQKLYFTEAGPDFDV